MKIQIFYLEKHDDAITVRDKLNWVKTARVLLVMPQRARILSRKLDLVLLQRTCTRNGSQLGLITGDSEVKLHAGRLGIPVFANITEAQKVRWRFRRARLYLRRRLETPPDLLAMRQAVTDLPADWAAHPKLRWVRLGIFTLGILAVIALVVAFLPSATIQMEAAHQQQPIEVIVKASPAIETANLAGVLPLRSLSVIVEGEGEKPVKGSASIADQLARGEVLFTNLGDNAVEIPVGTVVISSRQRQELVVTEAGTIAAGSGSTIPLPVRAVVAGETGNLPSGAIDAIKGMLGLRLAVTNTSPITGGSNRQVRTASQADVATLRLEILNQLEQQALGLMKQQVVDGDQLLPGKLATIRTIEETIQPLPGEPAEVITIRLSVEFSTSYISGEDLILYAGSVMDVGLPADRQVVPGTLQVSPAAPPVVDEDGILTWEFTAERQVKPIYDAQDVARLVQGTTRRRAQDRLAQNYHLETIPIILLNPSWWPSLPIFPFRTIVYQGGDS